MRALLFTACIAATGFTAAADTITLRPEPVQEWKPVYGTVETRDRVPARARIPGTITELLVSEGDQVTSGQAIARIEDDKLLLQVEALDARLEALASRLATAQADLERGQQLSENGVITGQRLEGLQTAVDVLNGEIAGTEAEKLVVKRQIEEGSVLAPETGIVLDVPVSLGSVINPGEPVAVIGGGGVFLRLSIPERHALSLAQGDPISIDGTDGQIEGRLAKIYPQISGGRIEADVEVDGLSDTFVGLRMPVRLTVGTHDALIVPAASVTQIGGIDFVAVEQGGHTIEKAVVPGATMLRDGVEWVEILTGLNAGDVVVTDHE
jgi:multidrug efflux system membrane fusion protein